ncbi:substrate-binding domain-containing protein [Winogradskyella luteola]|uniref:Substrate-binding domain-containing protein n=1 Tax=Winogradskyella luteola TaxID=2828330 RepID=A0A9X1JRB0_9FLAO|nr:substrate-binding domain-containing protein [Winogradskyella luteola]MBV7270699.1 substrate-binding domain-containing protein [Winogradskyella luteola]
MNNKKSLLKALLIIIVIGLIGYFVYQSFLKKDSDSGVVKIGFLVPTLENPFFVDMTESAKNLENEKLKVFIQASQDELKQNQIIENFIAQGVDAICIVPINSESIIPAIIKANNANIPVINVDNKINLESAKNQGAVLATYIGSDNFEGGQSAGEYIAESINEQGKVAILEGVSGNDAAIKRKGGFEDVMKRYPNIQIVASQAADWNRQKAKDVFDAIMTANPDLDAVFAANDEMALGVIAAMKNKRIALDSIIVVGFDAADEAIKAVELGELNATIAQQPKLMGAEAVRLVLSIVKKESVKDSYSTPLKVIK